jgi:hypothetical protein
MNRKFANIQQYWMVLNLQFIRCKASSKKKKLIVSNYKDLYHSNYSMPVLFEKLIRGRSYKFLQVENSPSNEAIYTVEFIHDKGQRRERFRMKKDADGHWKIQAQRLPDYVLQAEYELGDAISDGQAKGKTTNLSDDFSEG